MRVKKSKIFCFAKSESRRGEDFVGIKKRGISPVIATVLLIAMVVIIGLIIFLWFRGMGTETITKFGGTNIELVCNDVQFEGSYNAGTLYITNNGNVPIYSMKVKIEGDGSHETKDVTDLSGNWPSSGLGQGGVFSGSVSVSGDKIILIPVLLGESDSGKKPYTCDENQHGLEITI